jgi:hypothetical protein
MGIQVKIDQKLSSRHGNYEIPSDYDSDMINYLKRTDALQKWENEFYDGLDSFLHKYTKQVSSLKTSILGSFIIQKAPILPLMGNTLNLDPDKIRASGIKMLVAGGFHVFEDQLLLGINFKAFAKETSEVEKYRLTCKKYLEQLAEYEDKIEPLSYALTQLNELEEEVAYLSNEIDNPADSPDAKEARELRLKSLKNKELELKKQIDEYKVKYKNILDKKDALQDEYKEYKAINKDIVKGKNKDFDDLLFERLLDSIQEINKNLEEPDQIIFPEAHKFNLIQVKIKGITNKELRPTGVYHGDIVYYWVMKRRVFYAWNKLTGGVDMKFLGWDFPQHRWTKVKDKIEREVKSSDEYVEEILKLFRLGSNKDTAYKKMKVFLVKQHKEMDKYYEEVFEKVWAEADEVLKERRKS